MVLGLDYHNVLTQHPKELNELAHIVRKTGGKVFIISAITAVGLEKHGGEEAYKAEIAKLAKEFDEIVVVVGPVEMFPRMKYVAVRDKKVELMFDDLNAIVDFLHSKGEFAVRVPPPKHGKDQ